MIFTEYIFLLIISSFSGESILYTIHLMHKRCAVLECNYFILLFFQTNDDLNDHDMDSASDAGSESGGEINSIDAQKLDASHREILEKLKRQEAEEREEIERELHEAQKDALDRVRRHEELIAQELRTHADELRPISNPLLQRPPTLPHDDNKDHTSDHTGVPSPPNSSGMESPEIKTQRPLGLLAHHGLMTKSYNAFAGLGAAMFDRDRISHDRLSQATALDFYARAQHLAQQAAANAASSQHLPAHPFMPFGAPDRFLPAHVTPPSSPHTNGSDGAPSGSPNHHWTFEEQFKQVSSIHKLVK